MYKVIIAEDELLVRMGIAASVPWDELSLQVVASVADGERAAACCEELHPDILLTDIRMPKLGGLELLRQLREHGMTTRVIVITCLEDFNVLHKAFQLGVTGYLLKATMTHDDLLALLRRAVAELDDAHGYSGGAIRSVIHNEPVADTGAVLYASFSGSQVMPMQVKSASAVILEKLSSLGLWNAESHGNQTEFTLSLPATVPGFDRVRTTLADTVDYLRRVLELTPSMVYYIHDTIPEKLRILPERAETLLADAYFSANTMLLLSPDFTCRSPSSQEILTRLTKNPAYTGYRTGVRQERSLKLLGNIAHAYGVTRRSFDDTVLAFAENAFGTEGFLPSPAALERLRAEVPASPSADSTLSMLADAYPDLSLHPVYGDDLRRTILYIQKNLSEQLTLPVLARQINLSANYYAILFKQAVGMSVTEYIARLRLEQACDYLIEDTMSVQEIARCCGFSDVTYFSRFFKAYTGLPPRRWKLRHEKV
ncbi:MAG: response regulator [Clostridiaceae bacterium]|nr:response regulator [Clostridiaceae bacterium]